MSIDPIALYASQLRAGLVDSLNKPWATGKERTLPLELLVGVIQLIDTMEWFEDYDAWCARHEAALERLRTEKSKDELRITFLEKQFPADQYVCVKIHSGANKLYSDGPSVRAAIDHLMEAKL